MTKINTNVVEPKNKGYGARMILAALGGLGMLVAGVKGQYYADRSTAGKPKKISAGGIYGKGLMAHFDDKGVNWSAKKNKIKAAALRSSRR